MLEKVIWGNTVENWLISIFLILVTIIVVKLISIFNKKIFLSLANRTATQLDNIIYNSVESPLLLGIMLVGIWIAMHRLVYPDKLVKAVDAAYKILIVLNLTWLFARLFNNLITNYFINKSGTGYGTNRPVTKMMPVIRRTLLVVIWLIGVVMALSNVGVNISALLGTLGIGGVALALAAQDTVKNIFGAFTILTDKPFRIGDTVRIDTFEGTIIDVGIRSTRMRDGDKRVITFPNYRVADASIINISAEPARRVTVKLALAYDTTAEKMNEAIRILKELPTKVEFVSEKDASVNFSDITNAAFVITFAYSIEKKGDIGLTTSNVNMEILSSFNKADIHLTLPAQTLYLENEEQPAQPTEGKAETGNK